MIDWIINWREITVTCECGRLIPFDKDDLENCINRTCPNCGRMISAHMDICISPPVIVESEE